MRESRYLARRQFAARRHAEDVIPVTDGPNEQTLFRMAGNHGWSAVASANDGLSAIETQIGLLLCRAMTGLTLFVQERPDGLFEEFDILGAGGLGYDKGRGQPPNRAK